MYVCVWGGGEGFLRPCQYLGYVLRNGGWTDQFERIWKEAIVEGLRKPTEYPSKDNRYPDQGSNRTLPEY
jgi:MoaA/NifB/PqqE/SkfB family radical SAM enzyme